MCCSYYAGFHWDCCDFLPLTYHPHSFDTMTMQILDSSSRLRSIAHLGEGRRANYFSVFFSNFFFWFLFVLSNFFKVKSRKTKTKKKFYGIFSGLIFSISKFFCQKKEILKTETEKTNFSFSCVAVKYFPLFYRKTKLLGCVCLRSYQFTLRNSLPI